VERGQGKGSTNTRSYRILNNQMRSYRKRLAAHPELVINVSEVRIDPQMEMLSGAKV
jgi:hypothetical protein